MFSVENYINTIKSNLEKQSDLLVGNLKNVNAFNFAPDIDLLDFSASIEPTRFEISITMFSMDKEGNEIFYEGTDNKTFAGSVELLPEIEYFQINISHLDDFNDFYEENEETLVSEEQKVFINWFNECWETAGGQGLHLPSFFVFHDYNKSFDLKNRQWIADENKWGNANPNKNWWKFW